MDIVSYRADVQCIIQYFNTFACMHFVALLTDNEMRGICTKEIVPIS